LISLTACLTRRIAGCDSRKPVVVYSAHAKPILLRHADAITGPRHRGIRQQRVLYRCGEALEVCSDIRPLEELVDFERQQVPMIIDLPVLVAVVEKPRDADTLLREIGNDGIDDRRGDWILLDGGPHERRPGMDFQCAERTHKRFGVGVGFRL
jgi:hypothetical protein